MTRAELRARIVKLRALAARPGTPEEGATARRIADDLERKLTADLPPATSKPEERGPFRFNDLPPRRPGDALVFLFVEIIVDELGRKTTRTSKWP